MPLILSAFAAGLMFGLGLVVSQMVNPAKVLAFLDIFGAWDPSLALVMAAAVGISGLGYALARRRGAPVLARKLDIPTCGDLEPRLLVGAALFGIGWGLVGLCPGPAITLLPFGPPKAFVFTAAMLAGMLAFQVVPTEWQPSNFRGGPQPAEE
jgi:uncharacterized membrane protein YedE/YeeE